MFLQTWSYYLNLRVTLITKQNDCLIDMALDIPPSPLFKPGMRSRRYSIVKPLLFIMFTIVMTVSLSTAWEDAISMFVFGKLGFNASLPPVNVTDFPFLRAPPPPRTLPSWFDQSVARLNSGPSGAPPTWWPNGRTVHPYTKYQAGGSDGLNPAEHLGKAGHVGFITFEPWGGGWNNRRMSLELAIALALMTNRTLVLPPVTRNIMLTGRTGYETFFDMWDLSRLLNVLTYDQFAAVYNASIVPLLTPAQVRANNYKCKADHGVLATICEAFAPMARASVTRVCDMPITTQVFMHPCSVPRSIGGCYSPNISTPKSLPLLIPRAAAVTNATNAAAEKFARGNDADPVLRAFVAKRQGVSVVPPSWFWPTGTSIWRDSVELARAAGANMETIDLPTLEAIVAKAPAVDRTKHQTTRPLIIHFPRNLFMLWYHIFWQPSWTAYGDLAMGMRDHLHLRGPLVWAAYRVAKLLGHEYVAIHFRRTDFKDQFKHAYLDPAQVVRNVRPLVGAKTPIYLATDDGDKAFIHEMTSAFPDRVVLIADFVPSIINITDSEIPIVEKLICAFARYFVGTRLSTFSGYIQRLRGYVAGKSKPHPDYASVFFTDENVTLPRTRDHPLSFGPAYSGPLARVICSVIVSVAGFCS